MKFKQEKFKQEDKKWVTFLMQKSGFHVDVCRGHGATVLELVLRLHLRTLITSYRTSIAFYGTSIASQYLKKWVVMNPWVTFYWLLARRSG